MFKTILTIYLSLLASSLLAQIGSVKGRVLSKETGEPIEDASVFLIGTTRLSTMTEKDGSFRFERVPAGKFDIIALRIGFQTEKKEIAVKPNQTAEVAFVMMPKGLRVAEIVVTAKEETRGSELGTTSRIERSAIEPVEKIWVRAGYGVTAKAPPLGYLYPNPRFFDLVGLNFFANNPAERLLIVTTRRIEPNTASLRAAENRKVEMGVDWSASFVNLSVTAFDEVTTGGFALARQVVPLTFPVFRVTQTNPGAPPAFAFDSTGKFLGQYDAPVNTRRIENQGVELTADFAEWKPIRTSLNLNLAWIYSRSTSDERFINTDALLSASARGRVGIFNAGNGSERRRLVTSLRLIHRAPQVGLVVSFLAQTIWIDRDQPVGLSNFPIGFLDIDGNQTLLTEEQARSEEFADLRRGLNDVVFREENPPALWLFNIRVTKELSELLQVSFYANNALADRPLYAVNRNANPTRLIFQRRNPVLFFGAEIVLTL